MTKLEKAMELHPEMSEKEIKKCCPDGLNIDSMTACPSMSEVEKDYLDNICDHCWAQEYKEG